MTRFAGRVLRPYTISAAGERYLTADGTRAVDSEAHADVRFACDTLFRSASDLARHVPGYEAPADLPTAGAVPAMAAAC
jgi:hypothetical protein